GINQIRLRSARVLNGSRSSIRRVNRNQRDLPLMHRGHRQRPIGKMIIALVGLDNQVRRVHIRAYCCPCCNPRRGHSHIQEAFAFVMSALVGTELPEALIVNVFVVLPFTKFTRTCGVAVFAWFARTNTLTHALRPAMSPTSCAG